MANKFGGSKQVSEQYHVLQSNQSTKHGTYVSYFYLNRDQQEAVKKGRDSLEHYIKQRGTYLHGKKQGEWLEYSLPGIFFTRGVYEQGKKTGIWVTSRASGEVLERYDYTTNQKLIPEIRIALTYPPRAREAGIQGTVVVQYQLQADCSITDIKVIQSLGAACDQKVTQTLLKYHHYLKEYGPATVCETKTDTWTVVFRLDY